MPRPASRWIPVSLLPWKSRTSINQHISRAVESCKASQEKRRAVEQTLRTLRASFRQSPFTGYTAVCIAFRTLSQVNHGCRLFPSQSVLQQQSERRCLLQRDCVLETQCLGGEDEEVVFTQSKTAKFLSNEEESNAYLQSQAERQPSKRICPYCVDSA